MKGSDLLEKLGNLDPGLVAGAAEPPGVKPRRRGFEWGGLLAGAACIAAVALPLLLTYLVHGVTPTIEYGPGARSSNTSHEVSAAGDEGGSGTGSQEREANRGQDGGYKNSIYNIEPKASVAGYNDDISWTRYTLDERYCSVYPEGLPAEEYFKYNKQEPESGKRLTSAAWNDSILDDYVFCPLITKASAKTASADGTTASPYEVMSTYAERIFMCLPSCAWPPEVEIKCTEDGGELGLVYISTATEFHLDVTDDRLRDSWDISLTVSREPPLPEEVLASAKYDYNETVVIPSEGAEPITALGGLNTNRMLLCMLPNGMWCRIAGNFNAPYEYMVTLMNYLLSDTSVLDEINEKLKSGELVPVTTEEFNKGRSSSASPDPILTAQA